MNKPYYRIRIQIGRTSLWVGTDGWGLETVISDPPSIGGGIWIEKDWWRR